MSEDLNKQIKLDDLEIVIKSALQIIQLNKKKSIFQKGKLAILSKLHSQTYLDVLEVAQLCKQVLENKTLASMALIKEGRLLKSCSEEIKDNEYLVEQALIRKKRGAIVFRHASERLKNDFSLALKAISRDERSFKFISERLKNSSCFIKSAMAVNPKIYQYFDSPLNDNDIKVSFTNYVKKLSYLEISKIDKKFLTLIDSTYLLSSEASYIFECVTWDNINIFEMSNLKKIICGDLEISPMIKSLSLSKILEEINGPDADIPF